MSELKTPAAMRRVPPGYRSEQEQADRLGINIRTMRKWRRRAYGPTPTKIGKFVIYHESAESEFLSDAITPLKPGVRRRTNRREPMPFRDDPRPKAPSAQSAAD